LIAVIEKGRGEKGTDGDFSDNRFWSSVEVAWQCMPILAILAIHVCGSAIEA
jgi:hypothetical protein